MRNTSTLFYLYEKYGNKEDDVNELIDFSLQEFSDVLSELDIKCISPPDELVDSLIEYAKNYIR